MVGCQVKSRENIIASVKVSSLRMDQAAAEVSDNGVGGGELANAMQSHWQMRWCSRCLNEGILTRQDEYFINVK